MIDDKLTKVDIPESIEGYTLTLFWGLTIKQVILVFAATLLVGFGVFSLVAKNYVTMGFMFLLTVLVLLATVSVRGRNFYRHVLFIFSYYTQKPKVLIYHHFNDNSMKRITNTKLVHQKEDNSKTFLLIFICLAVGIVALFLIAYFLYHVIHK